MPRLQGCYAPITPAGTDPITGFAMIRLVNPVAGQLAYDTIAAKYLPANAVHRADIDPATGCWVSDVVPCNSDISPAGTWYEVVVFIGDSTCADGVSPAYKQQDRHVVQFDCAAVTYPDPVPIADVSISNPGPAPRPIMEDLVELYETPWTGLAGNGITITASDSAAGRAGNGHAPTIAARVSTDANNQITFGGDGGLVVAPVSVTAVDSTTIDLTVGGSGTTIDPFQVSGNVRISTNDNNSLALAADGLYVPKNLVYDLEVVDTDTVELDLSGAGTNVSPWEIAAAVKLAPGANSLEIVTGQGLRVSPSGVVAVAPGNTIDLALTGAGTTADPWMLTGEVILSTDPGNSLVAGVDGLFAERVVIADRDSASVTMSLAGAGTDVDPWVVGADVVIDPGIDNALVELPTGLRVETPKIRWTAAAPAPADGNQVGLNGAGEFMLPPYRTGPAYMLTLGVEGDLDPANQGVAQRVPVPTGAVLTLRAPTLGEAADADVEAHLIDGAGVVLSRATIIAGQVNGSWDVTTVTVAASTTLHELLISAGSSVLPGASLLLPIIVTEA